MKHELQLLVVTGVLGSLLTKYQGDGSFMLMLLKIKLVFEDQKDHSPACLVKAASLYR